MLGYSEIPISAATTQAVVFANGAVPLQWNDGPSVNSDAAGGLIITGDPYISFNPSGGRTWISNGFFTTNAGNNLAWNDGTPTSPGNDVVTLFGSGDITNSNFQANFKFNGNGQYIEFVWQVVHPDSAISATNHLGRLRKCISEQLRNGPVDLLA